MVRLVGSDLSPALIFFDQQIDGALGGAFLDRVLCLNLGTFAADQFDPCNSRCDCRVRLDGAGWATGDSWRDPGVCLDRHIGHWIDMDH